MANRRLDAAVPSLRFTLSTWAERVERVTQRGFKRVSEFEQAIQQVWGLAKTDKGSG